MNRILLYFCIALFLAVLLYFLRDLLRKHINDESEAEKLTRYISFFLLVIYVGCVLYITIFSRDAQYRRPFFDPLWKLRKAIDIQGYTITIHLAELFDPVLNIIMFTPLGYFLPWCFKKLRNHELSVIMIGFICSAGIEFSQHYFQRGAFETGDIICNTLGCIVGVYVFKWFLHKNAPS